MTKILFIGAGISDNLGGPSLLSSTINVLDQFIQDPEYTLISPTPIRDYESSYIYKIKIIPRPIFFELYILSLLMKYRLNISSALSTQMQSTLDAFNHSDIIIDLWGIEFTDRLNFSLLGRILEGLPILVSKVFNKPIIKYTADMGPFSSRCSKGISKYYINKYDLILARGDTTKECLIELGIQTPILVCPDTAFLLKYSIHGKDYDLIYNKKQKNRPIIGFSVSYTAENKEVVNDQYCNSMARLADYCIEQFNAFIVLMPNVTYKYRKNDLDMAKKIHAIIENTNSVYILWNEYTANELKGIISQCDILVGARYHSIVAALSMGIPTLAISWHHKYYQVMGLVNQEKYVHDIESIDLENLKKDITEIWKNKDTLKIQIKSKLADIESKILIGGKQVSNLLK